MNSDNTDSLEMAELPLDNRTDDSRRLAEKSMSASLSRQPPSRCAEDPCEAGPDAEEAGASVPPASIGHL